MDPIVEEVRRVRESIFARFNYDLWALYRHLKEQEAKSDRTLVSFSQPQADSPANQVSQSPVSSGAPETARPSVP